MGSVDRNVACIIITEETLCWHAAQCVTAGSLLSSSTISLLPLFRALHFLPPRDFQHTVIHTILQGIRKRKTFTLQLPECSGVFIFH